MVFDIILKTLSYLFISLVSLIWGLFILAMIFNLFRWLFYA
jgi:hypothetical protein